MNNIVSQLKNLTPSQLNGYVISKGWNQDSEIGEIATIWHREGDIGGDHEIIIPQKSSLKDYRERVHDVIKVLSAYEERDIFDIFTEISNFYADIVKVRVIHSDVDKGAIPVDDGLLLIQKAKELIASISLSCIDKKKHYSGSKPDSVSNFLDNLLLGQTEYGSFIVNIISPIENTSNKNKEILELSSFTRIMSTNLATTLNVVTETIQEYKRTGEISIFDDAVNQGLSANLCDALIGLSGKNKQREFTISLKLSGAENSTDEIQLVHDFQPDMIPVLEEVSKYFKENYIIPKYNLSGYVKKLEQEVTKDIGNVTVIISLDDKDKPVTFELNPLEYLEAIHAHEDKSCIECTGDLHVSPRSAKLVDVQSFKVINNGDLFKNI